MQNIFSSVSSDQPRYRSGAVARMARIPVSTLRIWERRYQVVGPSLTDSGHRLYTATDVERLLLIKQLIDLGHAVGTVARLPTAELQGIADTRAALEAPPAQVLPRVALLGLGLPRRLGACVLNRVGTWADLAAAELAQADAAAHAAALQAELLVAEMATLQPDSVERLLVLVRRLGVQRSLVVYGFGAELSVQRLRDAGVRLLRAPLADADLRDLVAEALGQLAGAQPAPAVAPAAAPTSGRWLPAEVPARLFDAPTLARLATAAARNVACECPRHLADLVLMLGDFETYSAECVKRGPADAALHADLQQVAGQVRGLLEGALMRVAEADGLPLSPEESERWPAVDSGPMFT